MKFNGNTIPIKQHSKTLYSKRIKESMLLKRQQLETKENETLAPYAQKSSMSKGRKHKESQSPTRLVFQRDRDRVVHARAFRRLQGKTQVYRANTGDHYRSRLTHTLEVAQIARDISRNLNLNEDLAETIALAHDLGHTPFGHAGEDALNKCMQKYNDSFEHNRQSRRIVEFLEKKYSNFEGLNLTFEVLDGLIKHRTSYDNGVLGETTLEAKVVNMADSIAYNAHDIDDGIRGDIISVHECDKLKIWKHIQDDLKNIKEKELIRPIAIGKLIGTMINDLLTETSKNISQNIFEVNFSQEFQTEIQELQEFLMKKFYSSPLITKNSQFGQKVIHKLFEAFIKKDTLLPDAVKKQLAKDPRHMVIKDYIAGMTDAFAMETYNNLS